MVTALAGGPADGAVGSENDGNGNTRSDERQNDERIEDAVQTPKDPAEHGMNTNTLRYIFTLCYYDFKIDDCVHIIM